MAVTTLGLNKEPLPGYRLIEPIGRGGFGHVWKCEAPGGLFKAIKFVYGNLNGLEDDAARAQEELRAIEHIKSIRHPFLLSTERVENINGQLVIVMELADRSLHDLLIEQQKAGHPGIPREELLRYLKETAEVLDMMRDEHDLQHLDIKPRNLFLVRNHVKVADFGLVQSLAEATPMPTEHLTDSIHGSQVELGGTPSSGSLSGSASYSGGSVARMNLSAITPLYASPELFQGIISPQSDQYSLAIVYQELLTGTLPFNGKNARQLVLEHTLQKPNVQALPVSDRAIIERALEKDPDKRFENCTDMVEALERPQEPEPPAFLQRPTSHRISMEDTSRSGSMPPAATSAPAEGKHLPGYQFVKCLKRTPLIEAWETMDPKGNQKLVRFLYGVGGRPGDKDALETLLRLHHPELPTLEQVQGGLGSAVILVTDYFEDSLRTRYQHYQAQGEKGLPRGELLQVLESAAKTLDELADTYQIQHLELNPKSLLLTDRQQVYIEDFGVAQLLWLPHGERSKATARYSAPELARAKPFLSRTCDQYSLAMIYQEMLTGYHAFRGRIATAPTCSVQKVTKEDIARAIAEKQQGKADNRPNLRSLSDGDRRVLARALHDNPEKRFANCSEMIQALRSANSASISTTVESSAHLDSTPELSDETVLNERTRVVELISRIRGHRIHEEQAPKALISRTGKGLEGRMVAQVPMKGVLARIEAFCTEWNAVILPSESNQAKVQIPLARRGLFSWFTKKKDLLLEVRWSRSSGPRPATEIVARIEATTKTATKALDEKGQHIFDSLTSHLHGRKERRVNDRIYWPHQVQVFFLENGKPIDEVVSCQGKDLSPTGVGFYLPCHMKTDNIQVQLTHDQLDSPIVIHANIVRVQRCSDRLFEMGARFTE